MTIVPMTIVRLRLDAGDGACAVAATAAFPASFAHAGDAIVLKFTPPPPPTFPALNPATRSQAPTSSGR